MPKHLLEQIEAHFDDENNSSSEVIPASKKLKQQHQNISSLDQIPYQVILTIFDFVLFPLNRYYFISSSDMEKHQDVDFSASFRNWEIREEIGFSKLMKMLFGYFSNDPFRKVQLLYKHLDFDFLNCPYQHSQLVSTMRLNGIKSLIWPTHHIETCTIVDFPYWDYCPNIENLKCLDVSTKENYERFMKCNLNLKTIEFEHSDENEEGNLMVYNGKFTEFFGKFNGVVSITAHYSAITDKALLDIIQTLPNIEKLDISYHSTSISSIKKLFSLKNIREIAVTMTQPVGDIFSEMNSAIPLKKLELDEVVCGFFKSLHEKSSFLPNLTHLKASSDETVNMELELFLQNNSTLKTLEMDGFDSFNIDPEKLRFEHLSIGQCSSEMIVKLLQAPNLKSLSFFSKSFPSGDFSKSSIEKLTVFGFSSLQLVGLLSQTPAECFPNLNYLWLQSWDAGKSCNWKSIVANRPDLQIEVEDLSGSDSNIAELIKMNILCDISIYGCTFHALQTLKDQTKLKRLRFITSDAKSIRLIKNSSSLEILELPYDADLANWGEDEIMDLFENSSIRHISCVF